MNLSIFVFEVIKNYIYVAIEEYPNVIGLITLKMF